MRKHLYLITEHEDGDKVGLVKIMDTQLAQVHKNEEGPLQTFNKETKEFSTPGRQVGLGYVDFDSEDDLDDRIGDVIRKKLLEIDAEHREKAGIEESLAEA